MQIFRRAAMALAFSTMLGVTTDATAQQRIKFELWQGLTGDLGERVNDVCKRFNASQVEFEIVCITQGSYDEAVQNSIAAFRAKKHPTKRTNSLVGGASLWALAGKSKDEYRGAAAFFAFIAKPESEEFFSTVTGYIPVTIPGYNFMQSKGFYEKAPYKATTLMVYKIYFDGFKGLDYSGAAAQSIVLMVLVVALTIVQFRYVERRIHYK